MIHKMTSEEYFSELCDLLQKLGMRKEDVVYIASDITPLVLDYFKRTGERGTDAFLERFTSAICEMIGDGGTILVPVFTWDFCSGKEFCYERTKGRTGSFGNWLMANRRDFKRTLHPMYSFMVCGKDREELVEMHNMNAWGMDSPFYYLHKKHAKMLMINVDDAQCNTFEHYVEEAIHVPYRYYKDFVGNYTKDGMTRRRIFRMFVRDLAYPSIQTSGEKLYEKEHVIRKKDFMGNMFRVLDLAASYRIVAEDFFSNAGKTFYQFENYVIDWSTGRTREDDLIY